jgi:hypothetical protein
MTDPKNMPERRYDIDWLRVMAMMAVFLFRAGRPFNGAVFACLKAFGSWFWLTTFIGLGSRYLRSKNRFLTYANEAVLPFYILHQTVIVVVAFLLINWPVGVLVKYSVLAVSSFVMIVILYEFCIRRVNIMRFLFGMKKKSLALPQS